jgi:hypothetical protein
MGALLYQNVARSLQRKRQRATFVIIYAAGAESTAAKAAPTARRFAAFAARVRALFSAIRV